MDELNISKMTLHNYVKRGKIRVAAKLNSRNIIYDDQSVEACKNESIVNGSVVNETSYVTIRHNGSTMTFKTTSDKLSPVVDAIKSALIGK